VRLAESGFTHVTDPHCAVEDSAPFRQYVWQTLAKLPVLQVVCEVSDGLEAVQRVLELKPDLILLDIELPTLSGIEAARQIHRLSPESKLLFVSQETDPEIVQGALGLGAWGYVVKSRAEVIYRLRSKPCVVAGSMSAPDYTLMQSLDQPRQ
jgi:two-component system, NarL family, nitrate/nitrite response regulator NarL